MANFDSKLNIDDSVTFTPMFKQAKKLGIKQEQMYGTVVAVRFTKAKVFYDILNDYYGKVFTNVDSSYVSEIEVFSKFEKIKEVRKTDNSRMIRRTNVTKITIHIRGI